MKNWKRYIGGAVLVLGLAILPQCSFGNHAAAPAEVRGIVLTGEAKQDYIREQMNALFYPPENARIHFIVSAFNKNGGYLDI